MNGNVLRLFCCFCTAIVLVASTTPLLGQETTAPNAVQRELEKVAQLPEMTHASFGFYASYLDSNELVAAHNEALSLVPASTMKLVTTAAALEILGDSHRLETRLTHTGKIDSNGVLHGNLYIMGAGDPALGSKYFNKTWKEQQAFLGRWSEAVKKAGIDSIHGRVVANAQLFDDYNTSPTWVWGDLGNYYGASPSGVAIYDNYCSIEFTSPANAGARTKINRIIPNIPGLTFDNLVVAADIRYDDAYVFGAPYSYQRYVTGEIPRAKSTFLVKAAMPDPAHFAALELTRVLRENGIGLSEEPTTLRLSKVDEKEKYPTHTVLLTEASPTVGEMVYWTNMKSVNLFADHLAIHTGQQLKSEGNVAAAADKINAFWREQGVFTTGTHLFDGSGLSRFNALTPQQLQQLLVYMDTSEHVEVFKNSLPIAGRTGSLASLCKGTKAENNLRAKSGSMTRVRSYAGYVTSQSGRPVAFAMIVNNYDCSGKEIKKVLERLMVSLGNLE